LKATAVRLPSLGDVRTDRLEFRERYGTIATPFEWRVTRVNLDGDIAGVTRWLACPEFTQCALCKNT
jgi:hypothetical protein